MIRRTSHGLFKYVQSLVVASIPIISMKISSKRTAGAIANSEWRSSALSSITVQMFIKRCHPYRLPTINAVVPLVYYKFDNIIIGMRMLIWQIVRFGDQRENRVKTIGKKHCLYAIYEHFSALYYGLNIYYIYVDSISVGHTVALRLVVPWAYVGVGYH